MNVAALAVFLVMAADEKPLTPMTPIVGDPPSGERVRRDPHPVPAWLPRGAAIGLFINPPQITPHVRLSWELTFYERHLNEFVAAITIGSGFGVAMNPRIREHYQHVALGGIGYRSNHDKWQWGFQLQLGAVWYRASYAPTEPHRFESRVLGYAEGHGRLGLRLGPNLFIGLYGGYASPFEFNVAYPANIYVGGIDLGVYVDWR